MRDRTIFDGVRTQRVGHRTTVLTFARVMAGHPPRTETPDRYAPIMSRGKWARRQNRQNRRTKLRRVSAKAQKGRGVRARNDEGVVS